MYQHSFTIDANGTTILNVEPSEYAVTASGTFDSGTLSIKWKGATASAVEFPDGSLTSNGGLIIAAGTPQVYFVMSGGGASLDVEITVSKLP